MSGKRKREAVSIEQKLRELTEKWNTMPLEAVYTGGPMLHQPTLTWCAEKIEAVLAARALKMKP